MEAGFLNVLKPPGMTSHDVVHQVRKRLPRGIKVGHLGTLDPPAAGVLPVAVGWATRLIGLMPNSDKAYLAEIQFGLRSDTLDAAGKVEAGSSPPADLRGALEPHLAGYKGTVLQVPPQVSALKQDGQRAYDRARRGEQFELPPREAIYRDVHWVRGTGDCAWVRVACGPGTYVRSLARDLGETVGSGAILRFLLRLQSGPFLLPEARTLEEVGENWQGLLLPWHWPWRAQPARLLEQWPPTVLPDAWEGIGHHAKGVALFRAGQKVWAREGVPWETGGS
jgi:tRNA pseudouridine55 synthase